MGNSVINMIQIGGYKYNQSVSANHPLLCIFTYFKPATHKLPVMLIVQKTSVYHTVNGDLHTSKTAKMIKGYIT